MAWVEPRPLRYPTVRHVTAYEVAPMGEGLAPRVARTRLDNAHRTTRDPLFNGDPEHEELFYERGVHAVGVNEIAAWARASTLSLYRYFPSKAELVTAMLAEHSDRIHAWPERETADAVPGVGPGAVRVRPAAALFAEPGYHGCAVVNTVTDTRADPRVAVIARRHLTRYRGLLERRLREAEVPDATGLARQLLLLVESASVVSAIDGTPDAGADARAAAERLCSSTPPA
jgi:AcrR family transcriptional regulator